MATYFVVCLILVFLPQLDDSLFVRIEVGQSVVVYDPDGAFTVTAFDANHCPGNDFSFLVLIMCFIFSFRWFANCFWKLEFCVLFLHILYHV